MNISATSKPIVTKFYLNHHRGEGKAALGFGPDRIGTLVSVATDISNRVIMEKNVVSTLALLFLIGSSSYLLVTRTSITSRSSLKFGEIGPRTAELAVLERLEKSPYTYNGRNLVNTLKSIILIIASNEDMPESLDEFKFLPDTTTNSRVICPCASEKLMFNVVITLAPLFLIGSSSYWQVMRTSITSRRIWNFG